MKQRIRRRYLFFLVFLILVLFSINYSYLDRAVQNFIYGRESYEPAFVSRVIDGDTLETESGGKIRLLGINTPEKGEKYYEEARNFLENKTLNKTILLEFSKDKYDKYGRVLAYVHLNEENVNLEVVKNGFANYYFPSGKDINYNKFVITWMECISKDINLCKKSEDKCSECIELKNFDYRKEELVFYNKCDFSCNLNKWEIKDEGRKKFIFGEFILEINREFVIKTGNGTDTENTLFWRNETYVWTGTGDSLFLRDANGNLVLWRRY